MAELKGDADYLRCLDLCEGKLVSIIVPPLGSHLNASMGVARSLKTFGFRVEYLGYAGLRHRVESEGFEFRLFEGLWPLSSPETEIPRRPYFHPLATAKRIRTMRDWRRKLSPDLLQVESALDAILNQARPDLVIFDPFRLAYQPLFRRRGIPSVVLSTKALAVADPSVPPPTSSLLPGPGKLTAALIRVAWLRLRLKSISRKLRQSILALFGAYCYDDLVAMAAKRGGVDIQTERVQRNLWYDLCFKGVPEWVLWIPEMDLPRSRPAPDTVWYIGPCVDLQRLQRAAAVARSPKSRYLVYVAMGSSLPFEWTKDIQFLRKIIRAFKQLPELQIIVSTGDARVNALLGQIPANISIADFVPQLDTLRIADLVITHGGANTFRECVIHEVPMLVYPREFDQFGIASRVVYLGVGLRGLRSRDSASTIRRKALRILSNSAFQTRARRIKHEVEGYGDSLLLSAVTQVLRSKSDSIVSRPINKAAAVG